MTGARRSGKAAPAEAGGWPAGDRIRRVRADALRLPLRRAVAFSTRRLSHREFVLVRIETRDGIEGIGYTYASPLAAHAIERHLAPLLIDKPAGRIEGLWRDLYQETLLGGRRGAMVRALSAVEIALWDILGKRAGMPLYRLLGGHAATVPAYFSGGYYRDGMTLDDVAAEAGRAVAQGFDAVKIKVGGWPLARDLERIRVTREVIGPERKLALDANNAWASAAEALPAIRKMEAYDPWWIEEPLPPDDIDGHARLARDLLTPVATGEIEATRWGFHALLMAGAADILQPDACVLGGVAEWLKIAHEAAAHSVPVAPHWNADLHVHLAAVATNCTVVEYFDGEEDVYNFDLILAEHLAPKAGRIALPDRPGIGLVLDTRAVKRYTVSAQ
jgi:L-alanine-DL-glutamate epimerase-like enolase superfamily enzyme